MRAVIAVPLIALVLVGLNGEEGASSRQGTTPGDGFHLRYQRSGGFAGVSEDLRVAPERQARLIVGNPGNSETVGFRLASRTVEALRQAFRAVGWRRLESPGADPGCADCLLYRIAYLGRAVRCDSVTFPQKLAPVVRRLDAIVAHHRPPR